MFIHETATKTNIIRLRGRSQKRRASVEIASLHSDCGRTSTRFVGYGSEQWWLDKRLVPFAETFKVSGREVQTH